MSYKTNAFITDRGPVLAEGGVKIADYPLIETLTYRDETYQIRANTAGVHLDMLLPAEKNGAKFVIFNSGAHNIQVRAPGGGTVATIATNKGVMCLSDGTSWGAVLLA